MTVIVLLDTGPLGKAANPAAKGDALACNVWLEQLLIAGVRVLLPAIADYELRRNLVLENRQAALTRLNGLQKTLKYAPLSSNILLKAADLWAQTWRDHQPLADKFALDGDVILAAQAWLLKKRRNRVIIASENLNHLIRVYPDVRHWQTGYWGDVVGFDAIKNVTP